jgi:hypothetical protein
MMPIDEIHKKTLSDWLRDKGVTQKCPACGRNAGWHVGDVIAPPVAPGGGGTVVGGPSFPLVQVMCGNCAYVMHFAGSRVLPLADLHP